MSRPRIITGELISPPLVPSKPSQNAYVLLIPYLSAPAPPDAPPFPLYRVAAGLLGSLSVGNNLRPPDGSMTSQNSVFLLG